jgi:hypothetical protein
MTILSWAGRGGRAGSLRPCGLRDGLRQQGRRFEPFHFSQPFRAGLTSVAPNGARDPCSRVSPLLRAGRV